MNDVRGQTTVGPVQAALRYARRLVILVVGGTVLLIGVVMLVTPGPAFVVIPIGLAILGLEFAWARHLLRRVRSGIENGLRGKSNRDGVSPNSHPPEENNRAVAGQTRTES